MRSGLHIILAWQGEFEFTMILGRSMRNSKVRVSLKHPCKPLTVALETSQLHRGCLPGIGVTSVVKSSAVGSCRKAVDCRSDAGVQLASSSAPSGINLAPQVLSGDEEQDVSIR